MVGDWSLEKLNMNIKSVKIFFQIIAPINFYFVFRIEFLFDPSLPTHTLHVKYVPWMCLSLRGFSIMFSYVCFIFICTVWHIDLVFPKKNVFFEFFPQKKSHQKQKDFICFRETLILHSKRQFCKILQNFAKYFGKIPAKFCKILQNFANFCKFW